QELEEDKDKRVIIFSCYRVFLNVLSHYITERDTYTISGNLNITKRGEQIQNFEKSEKSVFLLTFDIGANGLNLQTCDTVYITDLCWNAKKISQAISRVLRMGQESSLVTVKHFTSKTGMENSILKMQKSKLNISEKLYDGRCKEKISKITINDISKLLQEEDNLSILKTIC